jgi:hypothetical protein
MEEAQELAGQASAAQKKGLISEIGQSFQLMGLMAAMLTCYVGLGLLAVRVFG